MDSSGVMETAQNAQTSPNAGPERAGDVQNTQTISADEIALYDRQIRLWGVEAQEKLRTANILLINIKALGNEIAKNLVLAGIGSLTLADTAKVSEDDFCSQFFLEDGDVGKHRVEAAALRIRKLNSRVVIHTEVEDVRLRDLSYFATFDIIIATDLALEQFMSINDCARLADRPFYAGGTHGFFGFIFADLVLHEFVIEREKSNLPTDNREETNTRTVVGAKTKKENGKVVEMVKKRERYTPLRLANTAPLPSEYLSSKRRQKQVPPLLTGLRGLWEFQQIQGRMPSHSVQDLTLFSKLIKEKHVELQLPMETLSSDFMRTFISNLGSELGPVCAFLGGQLAQDAINVLGRREQPIQNLLLFDGEESKAPIYAMHPIIPLESVMNPSMMAPGPPLENAHIQANMLSQNMGMMPPIPGNMSLPPEVTMSEGAMMLNAMSQQQDPNMMMGMPSQQPIPNFDVSGSPSMNSDLSAPKPQTHSSPQIPAEVAQEQQVESNEITSHHSERPEESVSNEAAQPSSTVPFDT